MVKALFRHRADFELLANVRLQTRYGLKDGKIVRHYNIGRILIGWCMSGIMFRLVRIFGGSRC